jgi:uncharacterized caspase-like protein
MKPRLRPGVLVLAALAAHLSAQQFRPRLVVPGVSAGAGADVAASPDGKWFVTSSSATNGNTATIWSTADGSEYRSFSTGTYACCVDMPFGPSASLSVSPDSHTIAAASGSEVRLFDARTASQTSAIPWKAPIARIAYHPHRNLLAVLDQSGGISICDPQSRQAIFHQQVDSGSFILRFSADGSLLVTGSAGAMRVLDWEHGRIVAQFDAHAMETRDLNRKLQTMAVAPGQSGWQMQTADQLGLYNFTDAAFSPDAGRLALVHRDLVNVVELAAGKPIAIIPADNALTCIFISNDKLIVGRQSELSIEYQISMRQQSEYPVVNVRNFVRIPGTDNLLMDLFSGMGGAEVMKSVSGTGGWASFPDLKLASTLAAEFSADNKELLSGINWATSPMTVWNLESGDADTTVLPLNGVVRFALSGDGSRIAWYGEDAGYPDMKIYVWNRRTGKKELTLPITVNGSPETLAFSSDGSRLAAFIGQDGSSQPKAVRIWSVPSGQVVGDISVPSSFVVGIAWQATTNTLAISWSGGVTLADASGDSLRPVKTLNPMPLPSSLRSVPGVSDTFGNVQFSPDGQWLAAYENGAIALVSAADWTTKSSVPGAQFSGFLFSPDSRRLVYIQQAPNSRGATGDNRLAIWDIAAASNVGAGAVSMIGSIYSQNRDGSLIAGSSQGGIGLFSGTNGELVATLYRFGQGSSTDWLVVTPDGLFDGTPGAWSQLRWRFSDDTFDIAPVEVFFQNFYHPGLLAEIAAGKAPKAPTDIARVDRRQPTVTLATAADSTAQVRERMVHLSLAVTEARADDEHKAGSGARDVRLFRNGTLVETWPGALKLDGSGQATVTADVPIVAGDNRFTAYAFSSANIKSADASLVVEGAAALERKGTAYVIAMGIDHYAASTPAHSLDLSYAEGDARDFATQFTAAQQKLEQFAQVRTIPLYGADAIRANLQAALQVLSGASVQLTAAQQSLLAGVAAVQPEDGVFLFYAGHGAAYDEHFYLIPQDYNPGVRLNSPRSNTISDLELSQMLQGISPARSFLIIDACNSGQAIDSATPAGPTNANGLAQLAYEKGLYILAASKDSEPALEAGELGGGHGFLTYALVEEGLKAGEAAQGGVVELRPWFVYAGRRVPELQAGQRERRALGISSKDAAKETRQHPRIFYRREPETDPFVVEQISTATFLPATPSN